MKRVILAIVAGIMSALGGALILTGCLLAFYIGRVALDLGSLAQAIEDSTGANGVAIHFNDAHQELTRASISGQAQKCATELG